MGFTSTINCVYGTTSQSLAPNNQGKTNYIKDGWDLTFSENHWSSLETTKKIVTNILFPYLQSYIQILGLDKEHKMVWIINC
jgi:hypothetical protein